MLEILSGKTLERILIITQAFLFILTSMKTNSFCHLNLFIEGIPKVVIHDIKKRLWKP